MKHHLAANFASLFLLASLAPAATVSTNFGSLGTAADGSNSTGATLNVPGVLAAPGDLAVGYSAGNNTTVPYLPALNPAASSAFTVEFWAKPTTSDNDDAMIANRTTGTNRSGWVIYQRAAATGWNFRMYSGTSSASGWELVGGAAPLDTWSHVVAVWSGSAASLYVNGALVDNANDAGLTGIYNPNAAGSAIFSVGALFNGGSPTNGVLDETAFYGTALTATQIAGHFSAASSTVPGFYQSLVQADGALLHLNNVPEPTSCGLLLLSLAGVLRRKRH